MSRYLGRARAPRAPRWLTLRCAAVCKVCGRAVAAGDSAFYDYTARSITCDAIACCDADGLTREVWHGSPVSGGYVTTRTDRRLGAGYVRDPGEDMADRWTEAQH